MTRALLIIAVVIAVGTSPTPTRAAVLAEWNFGEPRYTTGLLGNAVVETDNIASPNTGSDMVPYTFAGSPIYTTSTAPYQYSNGVGITGGGVKTKVSHFYGTVDFAGGFTVEAIFKASSTITNGQTRVLLSWERWWEIGIFDADAGAGVAPELAFTNSGTFGSRVSTPYALDSNYHHVAGIYDPTLSINGVNNTFLYVDGVLVDADNFVQGDMGPPGGPGGTGVQSFLAREVGLDGWTDTILDSVRISNAVLSPSQFTNVIPEPGSLTVLALGTTLLRRKRSA